jgi:hypothetical protein
LRNFGYRRPNRTLQTTSAPARDTESQQRNRLE